jgi:hypothetical protein
VPPQMQAGPLTRRSELINESGPALQPSRPRTL